MAADLFVRILFKSNEFDRSINNSRAKAKQFQDDLEKSSGGFQKFGAMANSAAGMVGKIAGGLGIAMGAFETFNKAINSNAKLQNDWQNIMDTGKMVTDQFFSALYSGDWTVFNDGIEKAIDNASKFSQRYSDIMKMLQVTSARYERVDAEKNELESIVEDVSKSLKERQDAQNKLDKLLMMGIADIREDAQNVENYLKDKLSSYGYTGNIDNAQRLIEDLFDPTSSLRSKVEKYRGIRDTKEQVFNPNVLKYSGDDWYEKNKKATEQYFNNYSKSEREYYDSLIRIIDSLTETSYAKLEELFNRRSDLIDKAGTWEKDRSGARDEITGAQEEIDKAAAEAFKKAKKEAEDIIPQGSILELKKKISDLTQDYYKAADEGTRAGLKSAIDAAETQLQMMQLRAANKVSQPGSLGTTTGRNPTEDIKSGYITVKPVEKKSAIQSNYDYADSLNAIGNVISSVTNLTNEGAAGWLQYAANLVNSISSAIPAMEKLFAANQAIATSQAAASAAATPIVGWITAIGAIGAMMAAFASIPKFANGGIIPGNMFSGDRVPVMANSGEMLLNRTQQNNLFNLLSSGGGFGNAGTSQVVEFEIQYDKLVGVLKNGERKNRRMI